MIDNPARKPSEFEVVLNFPYFTSRNNSMGVFYQDLTEAFVARGERVYLACLSLPHDIPGASFITPTPVHSRRIIRFLVYYYRITGFMIKNPKAILVNISQEFSFTPFPKRTINIVHDLIQLRSPRNRWIGIYIRSMLEFIRRSKLNIAVSATTQNLLKDYGIQSDVVYNWFDIKGIDSTRLTAIDTRYDGIFVGTLAPHKNFTLFRDLARRLPSQSFAAVLPARDIELLKPEEIPSNLVLKTGLAEEEYFHTLAASQILISPSLDEGYGRPPMEALLLGSRILLNDIPIYKELYHEFAVYFANDIENLQARFCEMIQQGRGEHPKDRRGLLSRLKLCENAEEYVDTILGCWMAGGSRSSTAHSGHAPGE